MYICLRVICNTKFSGALHLKSTRILHPSYGESLNKGLLDDHVDDTWHGGCKAYMIHDEFLTVARHVAQAKQLSSDGIGGVQWCKHS